MFKPFILKTLVPVLGLLGVLCTGEASWAMGPFRLHMMPRVAPRMVQSRAMVVPHVGFVPQRIPSIVSHPFHDRMFDFDRDRFLRHRYMGMGWSYGTGNMMYGMSGYGGGSYGGGGGGSGPAPNPTYAVTTPVANASSDANAVVSVTLPSYGTVWVADYKTEQGPITKDYITPPLVAGQDYTYQVSARFVVGGLEVNPTKTVTVHAGDRLNVDFSRSTR